MLIMHVSQRVAILIKEDVLSRECAPDEPPAEIPTQLRQNYILGFKCENNDWWLQRGPRRNDYNVLMWNKTCLFGSVPLEPRMCFVAHLKTTFQTHLLMSTNVI